MSEDEIGKEAVFLVGDPKVMPTLNKLKEDAASLASQYLHFWEPGEVDCIVILSTPGSNNCVYANSEMPRERLTHLLAEVKRDSVLQGVIVRKHKLQRGKM